MFGNMDLGLFRYLTRLREVRNWNEDCKGGRKPKFSPMDVLRHNLEEEIFYEEYFLSLRSR